MANRRGEGGSSDRFPLLGLQNHCGWWLQPRNRRRLLLGRKAMTNLDSVLKSRHYSADKGPSSQGCGLPSGHVRLWELDRKGGRTLKNWYLQTVVLEKTPESPLDSKEIKPVNLKGDQPWIFTGRTDAEAEAPVLWSSDVNRWVIGKVPDTRKDWGQKEKRASEDEMAGWYLWCNEHELGQTPEMMKEERPGVLQSMGSQRVRHNWAAQQQSDGNESFGFGLLFGEETGKFRWEVRWGQPGVPEVTTPNYGRYCKVQASIRWDKNKVSCWCILGTLWLSPPDSKGCLRAEKRKGFTSTDSSSLCFLQVFRCLCSM